MRRALLLTIGGILFAQVAAAQRVHLKSRVEHPSVEALRSVLEAESYRLIDRDTVIPAAARLPGDLVVVGATARLDGMVEGSVVVVGGTLYLRPGSRVGGRVVSVGGIVLRSTRATAGDTLSVPVEVEVSLARSDGDYTLRLDPPPPAPRLRPAGLFGLAPPVYERVNGLSVRGGAGLRLGADSLAPVLKLIGAVRTARWSPGGTVTLAAPLGRRAELILAAGRETRSSDHWIRGTLENSAAAFLVRSDGRDYYDSDFALLALASRAVPPLIPGETFIAPALELRVERDRSLRTRDVFTLFDDEPWRLNPPITEGRIASIVPSAEVGWRGANAAAGVTAGVEIGRLLPYGSGVDETNFAQLVADGRWSMVSLWHHTIAVRAHLLQPLGSGEIPPQRWSSVGGSGTLPTLDYDAMRGDHLIFIESGYAIPLPRLSLPVVGAARLGLRHAVGSAWRSHEPSPRWTQNLGAGLEFSALYLYLYIDPSGDSSAVLNYGVSLP